MISLRLIYEHKLLVCSALKKGEGLQFIHATCITLLHIMETEISDHICSVKTLH